MKRMAGSYVLIALLSGPGCHGSGAGSAQRRSPPPDAARPCRGRAALRSLAEFHHRVIEHLGLSGEGLYTGDANPDRFRELARLFRKAAKRLGDWSSGKPIVDRLVARRAKLLEGMAHQWAAMADALDASDQNRFRHERERLIELRAQDLALRKELRALYLACGLAPPL